MENIENNVAANYFLKEYFYKNFDSTNGVNNSIEVIFSPKCNLQCSYCYLHKYYQETFPTDMFNVEKSLANMEIVLEWMKKNNFNCPIEIFSGELFSQSSGYELLEVIYNFLVKNPSFKPRYVTVPSNFTFICDDILTKKVKSLLDRYMDIGVPLLLSASVDGKYMEDNRKIFKKY